MLRKDFDVHVVCVAWSPLDREDAAALGAGVTVVPGQTAAGLFRVALGLFTKRSLQQAYVSTPRVRREIRTALETFNPDVAFLNVIRSAHWIDELSEVPIVFDFDEIRSNYYDQVAASSSGLVSKMIARIEEPRMRRAEATALRRASSVIVSSPSDLALSENHNNVVLLRSLHAMQDRTWVDPGGADILFVGRLGYAANVRGLSWFVNEVMPQVWKRIPDAVVNIVGSEADERVRRLVGPSVRLIGRVEDVGSAYATATIAVTPIFEATGVQMKLIEASAIGTPTITTRRCRDLALGNREDVWPVADSVDEWVNAVVMLLSEPESRRTVSALERRWYSRSYSESEQRELLTRLLQQAVNGEPNPPVEVGT